MTPDDVAFASISALLALLARREVTSREVTLLLLERIQRYDARINGYITVMADQALADADTADARRTAGESGIVLGVPIALKDLCETAGVRTTAGSRILAEYIPARDATVVTKLRAAGAVVLGKTHMAEFAYGFSHPDYGPSRTPWDTNRSANGSSGGSGAVVAAALAYGAVGSDTGGSIRAPAAACGITGHKPTYGLVSRAGVVPLSYSLDHVGPMTRTAADAMVMLEAMAGTDPRDPSSTTMMRWQAPREPLRDLRGLRVGFLVELLEGLELPYRRGVEAAAATVQALGATVEAVTLPGLDTVSAILLGIMDPEAGSYHTHWLRERPRDYGPIVRRYLLASHAMPATQYVDAQRMRARFNRGMSDLFGRYDVLIGPTDTTVARSIDEAEREGVDDWDFRYTGVSNVTGGPAVALPCGFSDDNLPLSVQVLAPPFEDALALQVAEAFQMITDFHTRRPPDFLAR